MMSEHDNDGEFASVVWDTPETANKAAGGAAEASSSTGGAGALGALGGGTEQGGENTSHGHTLPTSSTSTLHRGASQSSTGYNADRAEAPTSASTNNDTAAGRYWIKASVGDAVKMLEGTKDAYVAYNVKGEVSESSSLAVLIFEC